MSDEFPQRCISTQAFAETFPEVMKRARKTTLTGWVIRRFKKSPGCYRVRWDHLKSSYALHERFFRIVPVDAVGRVYSTLQAFETVVIPSEEGIEKPAGRSGRAAVRRAKRKQWAGRPPRKLRMRA